MTLWKRNQKPRFQLYSTKMIRISSIFKILFVANLKIDSFPQNCQIKPKLTKKFVPIIIHKLLFTINNGIILSHQKVSLTWLRFGITSKNACKKINRSLHKIILWIYKCIVINGFPLSKKLFERVSFGAPKSDCLPSINDNWITALKFLKITIILYQ